MSIKITAQRPNKRTKIVATLGPASANKETMRQMIFAGLDVFRINFSHGKHEDIVQWVDIIKELRPELGLPIAIMGDLRGPRIRVGEIEAGSVRLEADQQLILTPTELIGNQERVSISFSELWKDVEPGVVILLDDGNIELEVEEIKSGGDIVCRVVEGGPLSSRRGLNLPGRRVNLPSLTEKDFADIDFAIKQGFDFLALSFVQSADDVRLLNALLAAKKSKIPVIAKIERKNALDDLDNIVKEAYGVMVARGDLALEMTIQDVPIAQKRIISACRRASIPVITATQMLESMVEMHKPTRAEATDVANAILDGTDALMLSGETAIGKYPADTIATMASIAMHTEQAWLHGELAGPAPLPAPEEIDANIAYLAKIAAESISAKAIIIHTTTGGTARRVACHRPTIPILALSAVAESRRLLALTWGVVAARVEIIENTRHMVFMTFEQVTQHGLAQPGDLLVITAGTPYGTAGRTNLLKVEEVPRKLILGANPT